MNVTGRRKRLPHFFQPLQAQHFRPPRELRYVDDSQIAFDEF